MYPSVQLPSLALSATGGLFYITDDIIR